MNHLKSHATRTWGGSESGAQHKPQPLLTPARGNIAEATMFWSQQEPDSAEDERHLLVHVRPRLDYGHAGVRVGTMDSGVYSFHP